MDCGQRAPSGVKVWMVTVERPHLGQLARLRDLLPDAPLDSLRWVAMSGFRSQLVIAAADPERALRLFLTRPLPHILFPQVRDASRS